MRHTLPAIFGLVLLGACYSSAVGAETGSRWWPFGGRDEEPSQAAGMSAGAVASTQQQAAQAPPGADPSAEEESEARWMIDSRMGKVSWPRLHMPELPKPQLPQAPWAQEPEAEPPRNTWAEQGPATPSPSPLGAVKKGVRRVGESTRTAWHKTVDVLTPGDGSGGTSDRIARRETRPSWWRRMLGPEPEPQGPQTITEWMAQDRLDP